MKRSICFLVKKSTLDSYDISDLHPFHKLISMSLCLISIALSPARSFTTLFLFLPLALSLSLSPHYTSPHFLFLYTNVCPLSNLTLSSAVLLFFLLYLTYLFIPLPANVTHEPSHILLFLFSYLISINQKLY